MYTTDLMVMFTREECVASDGFFFHHALLSIEIRAFWNKGLVLLLCHFWWSHMEKISGSKYRSHEARQWDRRPTSHVWRMADPRLAACGSLLAAAMFSCISCSQWMGNTLTSFVIIKHTEYICKAE